MTLEDREILPDSDSVMGILSPHWSIEGTLGVGYAHLHYSKYPCKECGKRLSVNNRNYLGPTRAAVSIIYLLK